MMKRAFLGALLMGIAMAQTYEIAEPDLLKELEARKDGVISYLERRRGELEEKIENFEGERLTPASENRTYYIDPTYCLEENIYYQKNEKWEILYPKGYCFNPIDYLPYDPPSMVVFNPCREEERKWVNDYVKDRIAILIVSGCPIKEVSRQGWERPVYYLLPELKERLYLKHTVSIISIDREKKAIKVEEVNVASGSERKVSGKGKGNP